MKQSSFNKRERLRKSSQFSTVSRLGKRYHTEHLVVVFNPNGLAVRRLGVSVGKRAGSPVKRNYVKRLIREFFRLNKVNSPNSHDVLVIAKEGSSELSHQVVYNELKRFFVET